MRVITKSKKSSSSKIRRKKKKPQKKQKLTMLKFKKMWRRTSRKLQAKRNRAKVVAAAVVLIFIGIWWFAKSDSSFAPTIRSNSRTTYSKNTSQSIYSTPQKKSVPKKHDSVFYNNSAPKVKNSRTQNYSSAYEN